MKKIKFIKRQDSGFKLSYGNSGETSLNLSNEIFDFISHGDLRQGDEKDITFRIYKEDCIKAMSFIIMKLPLYKSSSNSSNKVDDYLETFNELYSRINTFFGDKSNTEYRISLLYREDGRIYLKGLRVNNFSIRDYLVENYSALQFDDEGKDVLNLRILSDIEDNGDILSGEENATEIEEKVLLRQKAAATFLKKAMRITQEKDNNFDRLAALNLYRKTSKQLQINGFNLGRDKNQLPTRIDDVDDSIVWTYDSQDYVLYLEWTPEMMEELFFPVYNKAYSGSLQMRKEQDGEYVLLEVSANRPLRKNISSLPLQQIFYGAPGTGKSNTIKREVDEKGKLNFRVTFHPDSDYSTFVGCYKPTMVKVPKTTLIGTKLVEVENGKPEEKIIYRFVPQAFAKAYTTAWNTEEDVFLIIEEINRGNCAQIFGDLFQLLDRGCDGFSEYPVDADSDLGNYIAKELADNTREDFPDGVKEGKKLVLPKNLYIWATMNTSDQSLFPIDSAFKRRWDWVYMPIDTKKENWFIKVGEKRYPWGDFLEKINNEILTDETAEDKHLGFYFCKAENNEIAQETFVGKVLFYLWNDVFKVYGIPAQLGSSKEWAYTKFYNTDGKVNEQKVIELMKKLEIAPEGGEKEAEVKADENSEDNTDEQ